MSELPSVRRWKREATWRGTQALVVGGLTTAAFVAGWPVWIGIAGAVGTGALVYRWFVWRAKHGLRF
jgi:hypothetical protein